jgi:N-acetylglucosaminyldiphosphoundecaprenol N-acetyl-beta-D-mannosaminyltransferase
MRTIQLFGLKFCSGGFDEIIAEIVQRNFLDEKSIPFLITPNADQVVQYRRCPILIDFYSKSYFILPDGFPIVSFSKIIGKPLKSKLSGSDFFPIFWNSLRSMDKVLVVAPSTFVATGLSLSRSETEFYVPGFLKTENNSDFEIEADKIAKQILTLGANYVLIGLGFPKQELLGKLIYERLKPFEINPLFMLLGASFEFYLGIKKRAPKWMQKLGLEWLHRFYSEPKRLFRRYTVGNIRFLLLCVLEFRKQKNMS